MTFLASPRSQRRQTVSARTLVLLTALLAMLAVLATPAVADWQTGVDAFKQGDYDAAETAFRQLTETQPDWYGGHFMLGRVLMVQKQDAAALESLQRAHELEARPDVALLLARTAIQEDKASIARDALAAGPPEQLPAEQQVAWLSLRAKVSGDAAARLADLNSAAKLAPKDLAVRLSVADAALDAGRLDEAARHLETAGSLSPDDEVVLVRLLKVRLAQSDAASDDAKAATCAQTADAAAQLAKVTDKAAHLSIAGKSFRCADDLEAAAAYHAAALVKEPDWNNAYDLAKVEIDQQEWGAAEKTLMPYLETQGEGRPKLHLLMGRALEGQQRFLEAIPHYEIASDQKGIAHAREGQAALDHNKKQKKLRDDMDAIADQIGELEDEESGLR